MAYTYLIGWSTQNKWYYGVRFAKGCKPAELFKTYFTSSKHVQEFRSQHGNPDIIEVRRVFDAADAARLWETRVLRKMCVLRNDRWINRTDNISIDPSLAAHGKSRGKVRSEEFKLKVSSSLKGRSKTQETKDKISNAFKYKSLKEQLERKQKISTTLKSTYAKSIPKKWFHNPSTKQEKYFIPGNQPAGFVQGRL